MNLQFHKFTVFSHRLSVGGKTGEKLEKMCYRNFTASIKKRGARFTKPLVLNIYHTQRAWSVVLSCRRSFLAAANCRPNHRIIYLGCIQGCTERLLSFSVLAPPSFAAAPAYCSTVLRPDPDQTRNVYPLRTVAHPTATARAGPHPTRPPGSVAGEPAGQHPQPSHRR